MTRPLPSKSELFAMVARYRTVDRNRPAPTEIVAPGPGQESVWDYPRPPRVETVSQRVHLEFAGKSIADSTRALRVVETAGAPVYYLPPADVAMDCLAPAEDWSLCEWKGVARYWDLEVAGKRSAQAAWSYPDPLTDLGQGYERIKDHLAFYPARVDACWLDDEPVSAQPGRFYGGWVTRRIVGPIKGEHGSEGW